MGFEPTETHKTSTVFETVPFVHSGILPGGRLAARAAADHGALLLKTPVARADASSVAGTNLFPEEEFTPRPAWQVIEAARRQGLTGELMLATTPPTRVYLRDGTVYFAERSTDGTLAIRLLVEGVINREQMQRGTVIVNGVEHVGRMFEADPSIDRASVELCAELFTDDVMVDVANRVVNGYDLTLYKRHPSGIDRWYPQPSNGSKPVDATNEPEPLPAGKPVADVRPMPDIAEMPPPLPTPLAPKPVAEPVNSLSAPPITLAVPVTPGPLSTPPPPLVTQPLPITSLTTTSIPVIKPLAPAPVAPAPAPAVAPAPHVTTEADATAIADEVAEAIKRAFSGLGAGS